jgi:uncharacterized FlaG/YvyC family protein
MDVHVVSGAATAPVQAGPLPAQPQVGGTSEEQSSTGSRVNQNAGPLSPVVAQIFGGSNAPQSVSVNVSYRVEHNPDIVVMVMTDPKTGQEIAQVPAEVMVQIAQFFDKQSGVTLDRSA